MWQKSTTTHQIRFQLSTISDEYKNLISSFNQSMNGKYTEIIQIERIQNERWYVQYLAHYKDFKRRLNSDTERRLYHGCSEQAANSIIEDCFNRSFAGVHGKSDCVSCLITSESHLCRNIVWFWCLFFI